MPPGITTHSVFRDRKVQRIGLDKWARNESHTSMDFCLLMPPTLLQTVRNQSCTSDSSIQPFAWHLTTTSLGKFKFLGSVLRCLSSHCHLLSLHPRLVELHLGFPLCFTYAIQNQNDVVASRWFRWCQQEALMSLLKSNTAFLLT